MKNRTMKSLLQSSLLALILFTLASCPKNYGYGPFDAVTSVAKLSEMISETGTLNSIYPAGVALNSYGYYTNSSSTISRLSSQTCYAWYMNKTGSAYTGVANDFAEIFYADTLTSLYTSSNATTTSGLLYATNLSGVNFNTTSYSPSSISFTIPMTNIQRMTANRTYYIGLRFRIGGSTYSLTANTAGLPTVSNY